MYVSCPLLTDLGDLFTFVAIDDDEGNHQQQVGELIKQTAASIDNLALKMLFVTVQQNNLEVCIECAVNRSVIPSCAIASTYFLFQGGLCISPHSGTFLSEL